MLIASNPLHEKCYPDPYFPAFGLNTKRYGVSLRIQSECGKVQTRITPKTDTFLRSDQHNDKSS